MQEPAGAAPERGPNGAFPAAALAEHARRAFAAADVRASRLGAGALAMEGMSGAATRHLYNNLASLPGCRCLQIGAWKGSSVIAALSNNGSCHVTAVDDWSEFGGPRGEFLEACERLLTEDGRARLQVVDGDAFALDPPLPDDHFDLYIYDGAHDYASQVYAITAMWRHLRSAAIIVIDDINFESVRQGTADGCAAVGGSAGGGGAVAAAIERRLTNDGSHTPLEEARAGYWNGVLVLVIDKAAASVSLS